MDDPDSPPPQHVPKRPCSRQEIEFRDPEGSDDDLEGLELLAAQGAAEGDDAREFVLTSEHLLTAVFSHLCLEDLCRSAMVRARWREVTNNPDFWRTIDLRGRTLEVPKVRHLLTQHSGVQVLNARGVPFAPADLAQLLPCLTRLESLELEKGGYERSELEALSASLPALTRLVLAGGNVGSPHLNEWCQLAHAGLRDLALQSGRAVRLRIQAPHLTSLSLRDFSGASLQLLDAGELASLVVADCPKLTDGALRGLLCLEGPTAAPLPCLTHLSLAVVPGASDETLRLVGQRHPGVARMALAACAALTANGWAAHGAYAALRCLSLDCCDSVTGTHLSDAVNELGALEELRVGGCAQVTALRLASHRLLRLELQGCRALQELDARCGRLAAVDIAPMSPGLAACHALRRITLASHAVQRLQWAAFPALEAVRLQCPNLAELDLSECRALNDGVWESLGSGPGGVAPYGAQQLAPGCPQLRTLKLADCDSLRRAQLSSLTLECLSLSSCRRLAHVQLDCPALRALALEECTALEAVQLRSRAMAAMSLGTCPRLASIAAECCALQALDLRGCCQLAALQLACPALRRVDATFCSSLSDAAIEALAACSALQELVLAVCSSVTRGGLAALARLARLRSLDLSYTPLEDPSPLYAACPRLTSLTLSNNYMLRPPTLLALLDDGLLDAEPHAASQQGGAQDLSTSSSPACVLPALRELDVSYCPIPGPVLAALATRATRLHALAINGCRGGVTDALWPLLHARAEGSRPGSAAGPLTPPASQEEADGAMAAAAGLGQLAAYRGAAPEPAPAGGHAAEAPAPAPQQYHHQPPAGQQQHQLRSLSMVGSKEVRSAWLGLAPAAAAREHGLVPTGPALVQGGQEWMPVATPLEGLHELRLSLSGRLRTLGLALPQLRDLQLNNCAELAAVALACPALERLALQGCRALGEAPLAALAAGCPSLKELDLQYCPQVTPELVAALHAACPSLQAVLVTPPRAASP